MSPQRKQGFGALPTRVNLLAVRKSQRGRKARNFWLTGRVKTEG